jgi:hypothetical protein
MDLVPGTSYDITISSAIVRPDTRPRWNSLGNVTFDTRTTEEPHWSELLAVLQKPDGYDATGLSQHMHDIFIENLSSIVKTGDAVYTTITMDGNTYHVRAEAIVHGDTKDIDTTSSVLLPFAPGVSTSSRQFVTLKVGTMTRDVDYSPDTNDISIDDIKYSIGSRFNLMGRLCTVAAGSLVLVFVDSVAKTYPYAASTALAVTSTKGNLFAKGLTCSALNLVGTKNSGEVGTASSSMYMYDTSNASVTEVGRMSHSVDASGENGTVSFGVLHKSGTDKYVEPVFESTYEKTIISAGSTTSTAILQGTFAEDGLSWNSDDACIYFGSLKQFRIIMSAGSGGAESFLRIQSLDSASGTYLTRTEFSDAT